MKEIIYDLLCVGKSHKTFAINPEVKQRRDLSVDGVTFLWDISHTLPVFALPEDEYWFESLLGDC